MAEWREIYDYWFGAPESSRRGDVREFWFASSPETDLEIRERFIDQHRRAAAGQFQDWKSDAKSWVALILLLDQVPRNIFRGDSRSFAADPLALASARELVGSPKHEDLITVEKLFAYLPFEHSENIDDQIESIALFEAIDDHESKAEWLEFAILHKDIVARFGRFPHRNAILGRESTPEERAWLEAGGHHFGTAPEDGEKS
jgi:uncharacterized protein (DUF924 family)